MSEINYEDAIAIIGIDGLFPKSSSLDDFWKHLMNGKELSTQLTPDNLKKMGVSSEISTNPNYVSRTIKLEDSDSFDADFFGFSKQMATILDPQNRKILESSWHAIEHASYAPKTIGKDFNVGVFAGKDISQYARNNLASQNTKDNSNFSHQLEIFTANEADYVANWIAYKFGFTGPVLNIQTACSTSLSALSVACQNLQLYYCDVALVTSSRLEIEEKGYMYQPNLMLSQDGLCRPLDEKASGTLWGSAVVSLVLKRFEDAIEDKDNILALIMGVGINNDGSQKQDFMAPGIQGQIKAIDNAFKRSGLIPNDIDYIELHGTGTKLGDPVEMTALKSIYGVDREKPCVLGSIKANIGHTSSCAGLSGLLKIILSFKNNAIAPMANFESLNSHIKLDSSQFIINTKATPWENSHSKPRRAGLSSFGFGGTNVHVLLEEPPKINHPRSYSKKSSEIIFVSAKSEDQVNQLTEQFKNLISENKSDLSNIAYTSLVGREHFHIRSFCIVNHDQINHPVIFSKPKLTIHEPKYCLLFTGQGGNLTNKMGRSLYEKHSVFKKTIDECKNLLGDELSEIIWPKNSDSWDLSRPSVLQPAIFMIQYAQSKMWQSLGLPIDCVMGHSIGEITASCIAGSLSLKNALFLASLRGKAFEMIPSGQGGMLVVFTQKENLPKLPDHLVIAAYNADNILVISGNKTLLKEYHEVCVNGGISTLELNVTHSFHSQLLSDVAIDFKNKLEAFGLTDSEIPNIPMYSTVSGKLLQEKTDISYWIKHLLSPTLFDHALNNAILNNAFTIAVEIGPVSSLASLLKLKELEVVPAPKIMSEESDYFISSIAQLYQHGFIPKEKGLYPEKQSKTQIPLYPFKKDRYWIENNIHLDNDNKENLNPDTTDLNIDDSNSILDKPGLLNAICQYWINHLGCSEVKPNDDFFLLGGTSLTAIQIQADIKKDFNVSIGMLEFMTSRTLESLCDEIWIKLEKGEKSV